jgi:hypothetical protein
MAFVLQQSATYRWPIKLVLPGDGHRQVFNFTAIFNRLKQSRIKELIAISNDPDRVAEMSDSELLQELLDGWDDVNDEAGKPVMFSKLAVEQMADIAGVPGQIVEQFIGSLSEAKRGNSKAP